MSNPSRISPYVAGALAGMLVFIALRIRSARRRARLPPGPKPLPLIGNLLDMPLTEEWLTWRSYVQQYGDMVFLSALGNNFLLLGSHEVITELIEKRAHFNSRPRSTMLNDLIDFNWALSILPYGEHWRHGRKLLHAHAHAGVSMEYAPVQLGMARRFIRDLLASEMARPVDRLSQPAKAVLPHMVRSNFGMTAVRMLYGIDVRDPVAEAEYVGIPERVLHILSECGTPGRFLVDFFPWMKHIPSWFPGAHFRRFAIEAKHLHHRMRNSPFEVTKAQIAAGTAPVSMVARMLESDPEAEQQIKDIAGVIYLAGSDTTVAAVTSFFLAVLVYPDVQRRAQEELNRVVGRDRLPEFSDKADLPYLDALMRECLRWLPVLPIGAPHTTTEDDEYRGYFIPKGTIVLLFQWGLLQDPNVYPEPFTFAPERHLENLPDGSWKLRADVPDPRLYAFGFGRRVCPGTHIAEQSLFVILATVLHTLDVVRAKDSEGREVVPDVRVNSGLLSHAYPFPYELRMREDARELVGMCVAAAEL